MLKLTVKPGEYLLIGEDVKVVFTGGSSQNMHILVDAPKSMNIARSRALEKAGESAGAGGRNVRPPERYYKDRGISQEAREQIQAILRRERHNARTADARSGMSR